MAESNRANRFLAFLSRIRSTRPLDRNDSQSITHLAVKRQKREEQQIPYSNQEALYQEFLTDGYQTFSSEEDGLESLGWKVLTCGPKIPQGGFASITMAYKMSDQEIPLESCHLAIVKNQTIHLMTWREVAILRGLVHDNIVDLYGVFGVEPELRSEYADLLMLLEYANAGDLAKERERYEHKWIPEKGARYYMKQICAGLQYIHSKRVIHLDIKADNILLKYKPDGTKICMICDFGISVILGPEDDLDANTRQDTSRMCSLLSFMTENMPNISEEAMQVIRAQGSSDDHSKPKNVKELLSYPWFKRSDFPPIPKAPTPLLQPDAVQQIGYLQPIDPAGTISPLMFGPMTRHESRPASFAQRMRQNLRTVPSRVASRVRSLTGRVRQLSAVKPGSTREQVSPVARSPTKESSRVRVHHGEEERRGAAEAEPDRPSRSGRVRNRLTSMGRAIARPFRHSSRRSEHKTLPH